MTWGDIEPELQDVFDELDESISRYADEALDRIAAVLDRRERERAFDRALAEILALPEA